MKKLRLPALLSVLVAMVVAISSFTMGSASAVQTSYPDVAPDPAGYWSSELTATVYDDNGNLVGTQTYDDSQMGDIQLPIASSTDGKSTGNPNQVSPADSGTWGTSNASGCANVKTTNTYHTLLGFTAFKFVTYLNWCYNRANHDVSNVTHDWDLTNVDPEFYWRGFQDRDFGYQSWNGYAGAMYHAKWVGMVENCVFHYGCTGMNYPTNIMNGHSDGTMYWFTS
ncbi:MAG TPA: hypothetical protein VFT75_06210 [Nocardioidaceae bacterium]|jgi:hypothetical protein|nr:hypothetical protein [Nocardioidaceae bacterium]